VGCISPIRLKTAFGYQDVPCGRCINCLRRKRSEWLIRLESEHRSSQRSLFITLTYSDEFIPVDHQGRYCFRKEDVQKYFKRLRHISDFRYYLISEYGSRYRRPHYHLLLFNFSGSVEDVVRKWPFGFVHVGDVTSASINYVAAYSVTKEDYSGYEKDDKRKPFMLSSRRPGIGHAYVDQYKVYHQKSKDFRGKRFGGENGVLPRYYKEKIFTKIERQLNSMKYENHDSFMSYDEFLELYPNSSYSEYSKFRLDVLHEKRRRYFKNLKQNRDGKNF